jgi:hypothetical protein
MSRLTQFGEPRNPPRSTNSGPKNAIQSPMGNMAAITATRAMRLSRDVRPNDPWAEPQPAMQ